MSGSLQKLSRRTNAPTTSVESLRVEIGRIVRGLIFGQDPRKDWNIETSIDKILAEVERYTRQKDKGDARQGTLPL